MSRGLICGNCRFWSGDGDFDGFCRINPPVVFLTKNLESDTRWPITEEWEWCGKHEPKPEIEES